MNLKKGFYVIGSEKGFNCFDFGTKPFCFDILEEAEEYLGALDDENGVNHIETELKILEVEE